MRISLRTKLLLAFLLAVGIMGTVGTLTGFSFLSTTVVQEAMRRVEVDLGSAWAVFEEEKAHLRIVIGMISQSESVRLALTPGADTARADAELEALRARYQLDYLDLVDPRGARPHLPGPAPSWGGSARRDVVIARALRGQSSAGTIVVPADMLRFERDDLADRAHIDLVTTEKAAPTDRTVETRGMVAEAAFPVFDEKGGVLGAIYGGVLLNRKFDLVDRIRDSVFGDKTYKGRPVGTVTFFLDDVRIATNVMLDAGTRAIGTRVSDEVRVKVLDRGERFADRAFVVNDWYLSAYDPIRDPDGTVIGIIYVGLLEKRYLDFKSSLATKYLWISVLGLLLSALAAYSLAAGIRRPILRLVKATRELSAGKLHARVKAGAASLEVAELAHAFNAMAEGLEARTLDLERASEELRKAYAEAQERNRAYLETLGFVTHELKSPLASIVLAIGALRERILGPVNPAQESVLGSAAKSADYLQDTISNYLSLSRIEEGALQLDFREVHFRNDVIAPILERISRLAEENEMKLSCTVGEELSGVCDPGLIGSVFQNLLSNAVKYGRRGGGIRVRGERAAPDGPVRFEVWNEGVGFDPESADRLFEKFTRLGAGSETKAGTGLGLFVSRQIVRRHGGRIWAESHPGSWARFLFELPAEPGGQG